MKRTIFFLGAASLLFACHPKTAEVVEAEVTEEATEVQTEVTDGMPTAPIGEGKVVFLSKCAKCHDLPVVEKYTKEQWANILPRMIKKANLEGEKATNITAFIDWEIDND